MAKEEEYLNHKELEETKRKYRGKKIISIRKIEGKIHVELGNRKGTKTAFSGRSGQPMGNTGGYNVVG